MAILVAVLAFVVHSPASESTARADASVANNTAAAADPLDQLSSADVAVHVARLTGVAESTAVVNHADTVNAQLAIAGTDDTLINKPQVVSTALKSRRDIVEYVAQPGDTVSSLAAKFGVTSDVLRWSNGLSGDTVPAGKVLHILPGVNGIVYLVQAGDTPEGLAAKFQSNKDQIIAYNDAEIGGLPVGQYVIIPGGTPQIIGRSSYSSSYSTAGFTPTYGSNGYDFGWCTWYVASRIAVPNNWGNANTWGLYAASSGWQVSRTPVPGAIGQNTGPGLGHVAVVTEVSADGSMIKYADMNGLAGWGRVGYSDWVPASKFNNYIYR